MARPYLPQWPRLLRPGGFRFRRAFIGADGYFLPVRFSMARGMFQQDARVDGIYEAVGTVFQDHESERRWRNSGSSRKFTRLLRAIEPDGLFQALLLVSVGHFHLDGLTVRKRAIERSGVFNAELEIYQDTEFCLRLAAKTRLVPDGTQPVAIRRFHKVSRILAARQNSDTTTTEKMYQQLRLWSEDHLTQSELDTIGQAPLLARLRDQALHAKFRGEIGPCLPRSLRTRVLRSGQGTGDCTFLGSRS